MTASVIVVDANVVVKLLHEEADSDAAQRFVRACVEHGARLVAPEHFTYEMMSVARRLGIAFDHVLALQESLRETILTLVAPDRPAWLLAERIAKTGHPSSGFPSIYDSIYHALAIEASGTFVTADGRHLAKADGFGHAMLLKDWKSLWPR